MDLFYGVNKEQTFLAGSIPGDRAVRVIGHYTDEALIALPDNERHHVSSALYPLALVSRDDSKLTGVQTLVFDDIGKPPPQGAASIYGVEVDEDVFDLLPETSWRTLTSQGLSQYGYAFDPPLTRAQAKTIHNQLKKHPILGNGLHSLGQYYRLPSGTNTKPGKGGFRTKLTQIGRTYTAQEFADGFGLTLGPAAPAPKPAVSGGEQVSLKTIEDIFDALPNDAHFDDRDEWVRVLHASYGANVGSFDLVDQWSRKHPSYDEAETRRVWESIEATGTNASATTLRRIVEERLGRDSDAYRVLAAKIAFDEENSPPLTQQEKEAATIRDIFDNTPFVLRDVRKLPPRDWLYGTAYIRCYVSGLVAPGGSGKTSLSFVEAMAMASGKDLLGIEPRLPLKVQIWNGEDPKDELDRRLHAIALHYNISNADLGGRLLVKSGRDVRSDKDRLLVAKTTKDGIAIQRPVMDRVIAFLKRETIDVLIIDPFISSHQVPENSNDAIDAVVKEWAHVAEACRVSILLVHHLRKMDIASSEVTADDARGASAYRDALRVLRLVASMDKATALKCGVSNPRAYFRAVDGKASMAPAAAGDEWYRFVSVSLGNGDPFPADGSKPVPDDQVGVVEKWTLPTATTGLVDRDIQRVQRAMAADEWRLDSRAEEWIGHLVGRVLGLDVTDPHQRKRIIGIISVWIEAGWLKIVSKKAVGQRREKDFVETGNVWLDDKNDVFENVDASVT